MTAPVVVLDSGPLFLLTKRSGIPEADACRAWAASLILAGHTMLVPEIVDYECRRELFLQPTTKALDRLNAFNAAALGRYVPLTTPALHLAAQIWSMARQAGTPTSDPQALDGDVIMVAQILSLGLPHGQFIIATTNVKHIARFAPADVWRNITP